jgi:tetratricopeptide (TPR) repeat protein
MPEAGRVSARYALGGMYLRAARFSEAEAQLRSALSGWRERKVNHEDGTFETLLRLDLAQSLEAQGDKDSAETERDLATQSLLEAKKREWTWHLLRASDLMRREQYAEAVTEYKIGLHELPVHVPANERGAEMLNLATCLMKIERTAGALLYLEQSLDSCVASHSIPAVHHLAGVQCFKLNQLEEAERHYNVAIQAHLDNETPDAKSQIETIRLQVGIARLMAGNLETARQTVSYLYSLSTRSGDASAETACLRFSHFRRSFLSGTRSYSSAA